MGYYNLPFIGLYSVRLICVFFPSLNLQVRLYLTGYYITLFLIMQELPILSIDYQKIRKGDVFTEEQVLHHYKYNLLGEEEYNKRVAKFHTKEYVSHPDEYSLMKVKEAIEINCRELGYPVVVKTRKKQILILEDKEAVEYLTDRAESHIDNFKKKVHRLHVDIDEEKLSEFDKKQFEHKKNYYTLVQGHILQGQKSLKEMRKRKQLEGN